LLQNKIDALKRACLYSIPPNKLGYCGPVESWKVLNSFILNPIEQSEGEVKRLLAGFNALHPYLELIANANGLEPFDAEVIDAYWIGNQLLENVSYEEIQKSVRWPYVHDADHNPPEFDFAFPPLFYQRLTGFECL